MIKINVVATRVRQGRGQLGERQGAAGRDHASNDPKPKHIFVAADLRHRVAGGRQNPTTDHARDDNEDRHRQSELGRHPGFGDLERTVHLAVCVVFRHLSNQKRLAKWRRMGNSSEKMKKFR